MKDTFKINLLKNKSLTYMLPIIGIEVNFDYYQFLLNSYISFEDGDDIFCIMYEWSSDPGFLKYEGTIMSHPLYLGHADFGEKVVYKFKLTHFMKRARGLFVTGDIKDFSDSNKKAILDYIKKRGFNNFSRIKKILDKEDSVKSDPPQIELETVSKQVIKLIINTDDAF
jgi:hypothetical protein